MDTADKTNKVERLPILLSGIGGIKLLGVPAILYKSSSAGEKIAQASLELIKIWDCAKSLRGMVFDTTSSNTGAQTAACVSLQNALSKPLLWFACRHHIGEIILTHVWAVLNVETSKSPEISLFQRFQKFFPAISIADKNFDIFDGTQNVSKNEEIIALCNSYLAQPTNRDDYMELLQLTLLYLGDAETKATFTAFSRPGALHKARWMAKLLYAIKMDLLGSTICDNLEGI